MVGSDAHHNAHIEVGAHGFALFLAPDAEYPVLDVTGTLEQLDVLVSELAGALASRRLPNADAEEGPLTFHAAALESTTMGVETLHDRFVQRLDEEEQNIGGIAIAGTAEEKPQQGTVIYAGFGKPGAAGKRVADDETLVVPDGKTSEKK